MQRIYRFLWLQKLRVDVLMPPTTHSEVNIWDTRSDVTEHKAWNLLTSGFARKLRHGMWREGWAQNLLVHLKCSLVFTTETYACFPWTGPPRTTAGEQRSEPLAVSSDHLYYTAIYTSWTFIIWMLYSTHGSLWTITAIQVSGRVHLVWHGRPMRSKTSGLPLQTFYFSVILCVK
jgi:hypothetical protein